jgi:hypothetical protein
MSRSGLWGLTSKPRNLFGIISKTLRATKKIFLNLKWHPNYFTPILKFRYLKKNFIDAIIAINFPIFPTLHMGDRHQW